MLWGMFIASMPKNVEFLMVGRTLTTLHRNCLGLMSELDPRFTYSLTAKRAQFLGRTIWLEGADNITAENKIRGMTLAGAYVDELTLIPEGFYSMLLSRLSVPGAKLIATTNPDSPNHYVYQRIIQNEDIDRKVTKFSFTDNTILAAQNPEYMEELPKEYTGVFYQRYILGEWVQAEGLIYPMFQDAIGEPPDVPPSRYALSIDYGTQNAFAALLWSERGGIWYAEKEYYYSGRDQQRQKTDNDYYADMLDFIAGLPETRIDTIIDPSAASFIALLSRDRNFRVIPAINDVINGIRETASAMVNGLIKISPKCENWKKEAAGYVWDAKSLDDRPVKVMDHCLTADTLIDTPNGQKRIDELVGTCGEVWSYNTKTRKAELKPFHDVRMTQKQAQIYKITLEDGRVIRCTGEHPILTERGWVETKYLKETDKIIDISDTI